MNEKINQTSEAHKTDEEPRSLTLVLEEGVGHACKYMNVLAEAKGPPQLWFFRKCPHSFWRTRSFTDLEPAEYSRETDQRSPGICLSLSSLT